MSNSISDKLTGLAPRFLVPSNAAHRQYEALRAYFVEGQASAEVARRFGYTPGSFRVLCHAFRRDPDREFFLPPAKGPKAAPKMDSVREQVVALRKQNLSMYDIREALEKSGHKLSPAAVAIILKQEGFARLPRRADDDRPNRSGPTAADVADARQLNLEPRDFRTKFGGLFLFLPLLARAPFDRILDHAGFPGSQMVPAGQAMR